MTARGIRNNNPGNLEFNKRVKWLGQTGVEPEGRFATFESPAHGIRAIVITLRTYQEKYGINTIEKMVERWAPDTENDVKAYIAATGRKADDVVNMDDDAEVAGLVKSIIKHENGSQPYDDAIIGAGIGMARRRIQSPKPLSESKTMKGQQLAATGATGAAATTALTDLVTNATQTLQPLIDISEVLRYAFIALVFIGIGITVYARIKTHNEQDVV